ncbi:MAG: hypothetical protein HY074_03645 [Deltaproteobacteria bacterium]|nr:hypothetical protein [Deltaproteobacteria bacterium]
MKTMFTVIFALLSTCPTFAGSHNPNDIIPLLKNSTISLLDGIALAEKTSGPATSAKFEESDGKLVLSVYTVPEGLGVEPEKATLTELGGDTSQRPFRFAAEVFQDKEHLTRASVHMTLFQLSRFSLSQVIQRALARQPGTPIDVRNPMVSNHRAVADVVIADGDGDARTVSVDVLTGQTRLAQ